MMRILLIENDSKLRAKLSRLLTKKHYEPCFALDGERGLDEAQSGIYDAVILETELPDCSGIDVLRLIRRAQISIPVLLLSPKCGVIEKVHGLDSGADDFLEKPFADDELLSRLNAVTRRKGDLIFDNILHFEGLNLNLGTYELEEELRSVRLSNKELEIMKCLFLHGHNIIAKEELMNRLWGYDAVAAENNLEVYISYLRRKLVAIQSKIQILCIKNVGYRLTDKTRQ